MVACILLRRRRLSIAAAARGGAGTIQQAWANCAPEEVVVQLERGKILGASDLYSWLLRRCSSGRDLSIGRRVHSHIARSGTDPGRFLRNLLVDFYGRCGCVGEARRVFDAILQKNVFSWNLMIAVYAQNGHSSSALELFREMSSGRTRPNEFTYGTVLGACSVLAEGRSIHRDVVKDGLESDVVVGTALVTMYGKCGSVTEARSMFNRMHVRNVVSWNAMIAAYAQNGHYTEALELYRRMEPEGMKPNVATFLSVLDACGGLADLARGKIAHEEIVSRGCETDLTVQNCLIHMYATCGSLEDAISMFNMIVCKSVVSWTCMVGAYAQLGHWSEALECYRAMDAEGLRPTVVTFLYILEACGRSRDLAEGKKSHERIAASGLEAHSPALANALLCMYVKCGSLVDARAVFNTLQEKEVFQWNLMLAAYAQLGRLKDVMQLFREMDVEPDAVTIATALDACGSLGALDEAKRIHERISGSVMELNVGVGSTLVNMYSRCGSLEDARKAFDRMGERDLVSYTSMISAYGSHGRGEEALNVYRQMELEGVKPDKITLVSVLEACTLQVSIAQGRQVHSRIVAEGFELFVIAGNALIKMYTRCGSLNDARSVFDRMLERNVVTWTSMIVANAQLGDFKEAFVLFREMHCEGLKPDEIIFMSILTACSHAGLIQDGRRYFISMVDDHGIFPSAEHYGCIIDLFGRMGKLEEAEDVIRNMPSQPSAVEWTTLLGAYRVHGNLSQAARAAEHVIELGPADSAPYVLLSNVYAARR